MESAGKSDVNSILQKYGLVPVTKCSLAKVYAPAIGVVSYSMLSLNVMNPNLALRILPNKDLTNVLLATAFLGTTSYMYTRDHMKLSPECMRVIYSASGSVLLIFGSVLGWAVMRSIIPPNPVLSSLLGLGSGIAFIKIGSSYLNFVDEQVNRK